MMSPAPLYAGTLAAVEWEADELPSDLELWLASRDFQNLDSATNCAKDKPDCLSQAGCPKTNCSSGNRESS